MSRLYGRYLALALGALLLQVAVVPYLQISRWKPDLLLIVVVLVGVQSGPVAGSTAGFFIGLLADLISAQLVGTNALIKAVVGYLAGRLAPLFDVRSRFLFTLILCAFVYEIGYFFFITLGQQVSWERILLVFVVPNVFYTVVIGWVVFPFLRNWIAYEMA